LRGACGGCGGELGDAWTLSSLFGEDPCFTVGGWWQAGYHNKSDGIFNTYPNKVQLQQGYLYLEKVADGSEGLGFGGRVDLLYGTDGPNTQSFGNDLGVFDFSDSFNHGDVPGSSTYGWAIPQLYAEVAYHDVSVKLGHFYTLLGYQVVPATGNFFYSIPWTFNFSEAFTHTGALATYTASDDVTLYGGWTLGWDTGFDQFNGGNSFLGGASVADGRRQGDVHFDGRQSGLDRRRVHAQLRAGLGDQRQVGIRGPERLRPHRRERRSVRARDRRV
jgi:hypothetical protein